MSGQNFCSRGNWSGWNGLLEWGLAHCKRRGLENKGEDTQNISDSYKQLGEWVLQEDPSFSHGNLLSKRNCWWRDAFNTAATRENNSADRHPFLTQKAWAMTGCLPASLHVGGPALKVRKLQQKSAPSSAFLEPKPSLIMHCVPRLPLLISKLLQEMSVACFHQSRMLPRLASL